MLKLSRTKLELFLDCRRCFWLDANKGVRRVPPAPYTINSAIDALLKAEFDGYRASATPHPLMRQHHIDAVPYRTAELAQWRNNFTGIQVDHAATGFLFYGAVDDIWVNPAGELIVVDYKATGAKEYKIYDSYKRQIEMYQWLLKAKGLRVCETGYFVFAKVDKLGEFASAKLSFQLFVEPVKADTSWVEGALFDARATLEGGIPECRTQCPWCQYARNAS